MQLEIVMLIAMWQPVTERGELLLAEAEALRSHGKFSAAEQVYRRLLESAPDMQLAAWTGLTVTLLELGRASEALQFARKTLELCGDRQPCGAYAWNNLAAAQLGLGRWVEADQAYREAVRQAETALGAEHPEVQQMWGNLGVLLASRGEGVRAIPLLKRVLAKMAGQTEQRARGLHNLGAVYLELGEFGPAEEYLIEARWIAREVLQPGHPLRVTCSSSVVLLEIYRKRPDSAERYLAEAQEEASAGPQSEGELMPIESYRAVLLEQRGRFAETIEVEEGLLRRQVKLLAPSHPALLANVATYDRLLGKVKDREGRQRVSRWRKTQDAYSLFKP